MTFSIKRGTVVEHLHPAMVAALPTIVQVFQRHGSNTTLTEANDSIGRTWKSLHKGIPCRACDFRTWADVHGTQMDEGLKAAIALDLRKELGPDYDVTFGPHNLHVEFDPK